MNASEPSRRGFSSLLRELEPLDRDARRARLREEADPKSVLLELVDETSHIAMSEAGEAMTATETVVALADDLEVPLARARARRARARALSYAGRFEEALACCLDAIVIATDADEPVEAGRLRLASMHALGELGRLDEARRVGEDARRIFVDVSEPGLAARADLNLGIIHHRHEQPHDALERFDRARPHFNDEPVILGHLDNSRGEALVALNDFAGAEDAFTHALCAFEAADARLTAAIADSNLADLAARQGHLQRALRHFEHARRHLDADESPAVLARLQAEQADAKTVLGLPAEALADYEDALEELDRRGLPIEAARARTGMGLALLKLGRTAEAQTALAAATTGYEELGHDTARAKVDLLRAEIARSSGRIAEARRLAARALAMVHDRPAEASTARHVLAQCAWDEGDHATARADLAAAVAAARRLDLAPLLADLLETSGRWHLEVGRYTDARRDLSEAAEQVERIRGSLQADRFRAAFHGNRAPVYDRLLASWLDGPDASVADAFAVAEQMRSRLLLDQVQRSLDEDDDASEAERDPLWGRATKLRAALNGLYSRLGDEHGLSDRWLHEVHEHETELERLEARLASRDRRGWMFAAPVDLADAQARLAPGDRLVEYAVRDGRFVAFVVEPDRAELVRDLGSVAEVESQLGRVRFQIDRALHHSDSNAALSERRLTQMRVELAALERLIGAPLRHHDREGRLTIIPHGALHVVPFAALWDGTSYLVERHELHIAPSASLLARLDRRDEASATGAPLVVGVPDALAPSVGEEAARIAARFDDAILLTGSDATKTRLRRAARHASLLHFAGHGRYLARTPQASGLELGDGWMTIREIAHLELGVDVVVLSGCETGLSRIEPGEELLGLLRAFFMAGTRTVLMSLWRIDDRITTDLMDRMYDAWHTEGGSLTAGLRAAQRHVLEVHPHPAHWAPFVLAGRP